MSCLITAGATKDCQYKFGGLDKIYLANRADVDAYTADGTGLITAITMVATKTFFEYEFEKNTGSFTQELVVGTNKYFTQTVNFALSGLNQAQLNVIEALGLANVVAIVTDKRGKSFLLGKNGGLEATVITANSGAAEGDALGVTVTIAGSAIETAPEVTTSIIAALLP